MFQIALELKKKEIEKAIELQKDSQDVAEEQVEMCKESKPNGSVNRLASDNLESEVFIENEKSSPEEPIYSDVISVSEDKVYNQSDATQVPNTPLDSVCTTDNLLDLQFEMDTLQQGITQMEYSIASVASLGFGINFSEDDNSVSSGSSFVMTPRKYDRLSSLYHETLSLSSRSSSTSDYNMYSQDSKLEDMDSSIKSSEVFSNMPSTPPPPPPPLPQQPPPSLDNEESPVCSADPPAVNVDLAVSTDDPPSCSTADPCVLSITTDRYAVFLEDIDSLPSVFDNPKIVSFKGDILPPESELFKNGETKEDSSNDVNSEGSDSLKSASTSVFAELDPLGNHPYVDKKEFFYEIKNPPKKVLKELAGDTYDSIDSIPESETAPSVLYLNGSKEVPLSENPSNPFIRCEETLPCPPKLPPKRSFSVSSPVPFLPAQSVPSTEELPSDNKNPFNPFLSSGDVSDLPPPSSPPPPPPPPRLPTKGGDPVYSVSPPPRPPSRTCATPTPPLPRRKTPLSCASRAWYSFDQDVMPAWSTQSLTAAQENGFPPSSPPLPVPSRKIPQNKMDSPVHTSYSASSSPAAARRVLNRSPLLSNPVTSMELSNSLQANGTCSPQKVFSRHMSVMQELHVEKLTSRDNSPNFPLNTYMESSPKPSAPVKDTTDLVQSSIHSPPLPPKSISRPRPSPTKKMLSLASTSQSSSNSSVSDGFSDSLSTSSLRCMGMEGSRSDSASEFLFQNTSNSQSDDIFSASDSSSTQMQSQASENGHEGTTVTASSTSPDSIFRRLSDPFDDDFFRSLPKKSPDTNGTPTSSITEDMPCTNGFDEECKDSEVPPHAQVNKLKKEIS